MSIQPFHTSTDVIHTHMTLTLAGGTSADVVTADFRYNVLEPYAVRASFALPGSPAVEWVMARDLLREGLVMPAGLGDIRIRPTADGIAIELVSPQGSAILLGDVAPLVDFVTRTCQAVPDSHENEFFSIDAELDMLASYTRSANRAKGHDGA
ncbi:SsgA family sporulation/cell division regulator [Nakamurella antarctica]|uniref:SsgA family sporulation/cell division regulator n=1 Tax=Nakamurella antarctica TaxID=1902245 RepID=A0A3G8ZKC7_9ACTN|nr:SsgA family sporulation/cell division regulator [Nakamurella antarctica]AZI57713.1 SsgA family sporulation/cell division regulator [Nakamurella antarctica]